MRRKIVILFVIAAFTSVFGAAACSGEVQVEEPDEVPVKVQDGNDQQKEQAPQQEQKNQDQKQEKQGAEGKAGVDTK